MKYTVTSEKAIENLVHNINLLEDHLKLEELTEGFSKKYFQIIKVQEQCFQHLGQWYWIHRKYR